MNLARAIAEGVILFLFVYYGRRMDIGRSLRTLYILPPLYVFTWQPGEYDGPLTSHGSDGTYAGNH